MDANTLLVQSCSLRQNTAQGGIHNSGLDASVSGFIGSGVGAGIANYLGSAATIQNSSLTGNQASGGPGNSANSTSAEGVTERLASVLRFSRTAGARRGVCGAKDTDT